MKVAVRQQSLCLLLEEGESRKSRGLWTNCRMCGCCFKTQFGNFTNGWISSENAFVAPTRKRETLPKWADLLKNELFVVLEEGESFSNKSSLLSAEQRLETALGNCTAMLSQIREELTNRTVVRFVQNFYRKTKASWLTPDLRSGHHWSACR